MNRQNLKDLEPIIKESIKDGGQFVFYPSGISMLPTIVGGKDCVVLVEADVLHKYDLVLYKRDGGQYVLHRIMKIDGTKLAMCGDNQLYYEYNIDKEQIIAKADEIRKENGKTIGGSDLRKGVYILSVKRFFRKAAGKFKKTLKR